MAAKKATKTVKQAAEKTTKTAKPVKKAAAANKKSATPIRAQTALTVEKEKTKHPPAPQRSMKEKEPVKESAETVAKKALAKVKVSKEAIPVATGPMAAKWSQLYKKADSTETAPYNMKQVFAEKTAIIHKVLGWGYIMANRNDRLEVLFKDGIKYLISNYK
jgi:hypothetical protein